MKILVTCIVVIAACGLLMSCSDDNPGGGGGNTLSTELTEVSLGMWWTGVSCDTIVSDTITLGRNEHIYRSTELSHFFDTVVDVRNIQNQIYLVAVGFDTVIDPVTGNAGQVRTSTSYLKCNDTMLGYLLMPSWNQWDTIEIKALELPFAIGNTWSILNEVKDTSFRLFSIYPAEIHEEFTGTGSISGTSVYQGATADYTCYTVSTTINSWVAVTSDTVVILNGRAIEIGDTAVTFSNHNTSTSYIDPGFATAIRSTSISIKADSNYIDTSKAMVRDTVRSESYITKFFDPVADSVFVIR